MSYYKSALTIGYSNVFEEASADEEEDELAVGVVVVVASKLFWAGRLCFEGVSSREVGLGERLRSFFFELKDPRRSPLAFFCSRRRPLDRFSSFCIG